MDTLDFLRTILPETGIYFLATPLPKPYSGFRHYAYTSLEEMAAGVKELNAKGETIYHACAAYSHSYVEKEVNGVLKKQYRVSTNVAAVKAFWHDIDCGEGKPYKDQAEGAMALKKFLEETGLPRPMVIRSGNGLHVYWPLEEAIVPAVWLRIATLLKQVDVAYGLEADPTRTADMSSVLRPVGSYHRKGEAKEVTCAVTCKPVNMIEFVKKLKAAADAKKLAPAKVHTKQVVDNNDLLSEEPAFAEVIATQCSQIAKMRDSKGDIVEPHWYASIGVIRFCHNSRDIIHEWSSGHAGYSEEETDNKIRHHQESGTGPTTCNKFRDINPSGCAECPYAGKITSPIQLGREIKESEPVQVEVNGTTLELPPPPKPYMRLKNGGIGITVDGEVKLICPYDIIPIRRIYDLDAREGKITWRVKIPNEKDREFDMPSEVLLGRDFGKFMASKEIYMNGTEMSATQAFLARYLREVQNMSASSKLYSHMGWKDDYTQFVIGTTTYSAGGSESMDFSRDDNLKGFASTGDLDTWKDIVSIYNRPGMESYQFSLLTTFGAPLIHLSGHAGAVVSLVSPRGGQGKTTLQECIASAWGKPMDTMLSANDTPAAIQHRIAKYCNVPVVMDELTNMDADALSRLSMSITTGRDRIRLSPNIVEQTNDSRWSTILITSSNAGLISKVASLRASSEAEALRIYEIDIRTNGTITKQQADANFSRLKENYGLAGPMFIQYVLVNYEQVKDLFNRVRAVVDERIKADNHERFWSAAICATITGGYIAKRLGLVDFDMEAIIEWVVANTNKLRIAVNENVRSNISLLASFINENINNRLLTRGEGTKAEQPLEHPRAGLRFRMIAETGVAWIPKTILKTYLAQNGGDFTGLRRELQDAGALVKATSKRNIGQGTSYSTVVTDCIEIKLPAIGIQVTTLSVVDLRQEQEAS